MATSFLRNVFFVWAMLWMTALPLIHMHADGDDHEHGPGGHAHHGLAHTVFDGDRPGEFGTHSFPFPSVVSLEEPIAFDHLEISFTAAIAGERQDLSASLMPGRSLIPLLPRPTGVGSQADLFVRPPPSLLLLSSHLPHAPPSSSV